VKALLRQHVDTKISNVSSLATLERYEYFIRKVADFETVWGLHSSDGWATASDVSTKRIVLPFWPEAAFAEAFATGDRGGMSATAIPLTDFLEKWLPGLETDNRLVSVFPTPNGKTSLVEPHTLSRDIHREIVQYE
jgi:Protein of unknown function (DUF2750)